MKPAVRTIWPSLIYPCASTRVSTALKFLILAQLLVLNAAVSFKLLRNCYLLLYLASKCLLKFAMEDLGHILTIFYYKARAAGPWFSGCYPTTWSSLYYHQYYFLCVNNCDFIDPHFKCEIKNRQFLALFRASFQYGYHLWSTFTDTTGKSTFLSTRDLRSRMLIFHIRP